MKSVHTIFWENTDQKNSEYGHFSRGVICNPLWYEVETSISVSLCQMKFIGDIANLIM